MYVDEATIHYIASFLEHYDVQNKIHRDSIKQLRDVSNYLIEHLYKPATVSIIRKTKD